MRQYVYFYIQISRHSTRDCFSFSYQFYHFAVADSSRHLYYYFLAPRTYSFAITHLTLFLRYFSTPVASGALVKFSKTAEYGTACFVYRTRSVTAFASNKITTLFSALPLARGARA